MAWRPAELAKKPAKIACVGTLVSDGKTYYIFKYKRSWFARYMLGVCGGYEGDSLENDGCVWSEMEPFREETAEDDARAPIAAIQECLRLNPSADGFPCWNLIWPGVCLNDANEVNGYTCGLRDFGFDEIEAFNWRDESPKLADFLCEVANYVVTQNVRPTDGSKVGSIG